MVASMIFLFTIHQLPFTALYFHHVLKGLVTSNPKRLASSNLNGPCIFR